MDTKINYMDMHNVENLGKHPFGYTIFMSVLEPTLVLQSESIHLAAGSPKKSKHIGSVIGFETIMFDIPL